MTPDDFSPDLTKDDVLGMACQWQYERDDYHMRLDVPNEQPGLVHERAKALLAQVDGWVR